MVVTKINENGTLYRCVDIHLYENIVKDLLQTTISSAFSFIILYHVILLIFNNTSKYLSNESHTSKLIQQLIFKRLTTYTSARYYSAFRDLNLVKGHIKNKALESPNLHRNNRKVIKNA